VLIKSCGNYGLHWKPGSWLIAKSVVLAVVLSTSGVAWSEDGPFLLPPGATAGKETCAGAILVAAANQAPAQGVVKTDSKGGTGAMPGKLALTAKVNRVTNKDKSVTVTNQKHLWLRLCPQRDLRHQLHADCG